jgi:hypothetical protein
VLDAKIDKGSTLSPISHIHQSQLHQVSTYRTSQNPDKGITTPEEVDLVRRDNIIHFPRSDCPRFQGSNLLNGS